MQPLNLNSLNMGSNPLLEMSNEVYMVVIIISIIIGLLQCFLGYRKFKFILGVLGFMFGAILAGTIGLQISEESYIALISGVLGGFVGAALFMVLYYIGIFVMGAALGGGLAYLIISTSSNSESIPLIVMAVIGGILALVLQKLMIIISTAFGGSWAVVSGVSYFTTNFDMRRIEYFLRRAGTQLYVILLCTLVLAICGIVIQYRASSPKIADNDEKSSEKIKD